MIDGKRYEPGAIVERRPSEGIVKLGLRFQQLEAVKGPDDELKPLSNSGAPLEPAHTEPVPPGAQAQGGSRPPGEIEAQEQKQKEKVLSGRDKTRRDFDTRFKPSAKVRTEPLTEEQLAKEERSANAMDARRASESQIPAGDAGPIGNETRVDGNTGEVIVGKQ